MKSNNEAGRRMSDYFRECRDVALSICLLLIVPVTAVLLNCPTNLAQASETVTTMVQVSRLSVKGMTCDGCAQRIKGALEKIQGVQKATVSYKKGSVEVSFDSSKVQREAFIKAIHDLGYQAS